MKQTDLQRVGCSYYFLCSRCLIVLLTVLVCLPTISRGQGTPPPITSSGLNTQISDPVSVVTQTQYNITGGTRPEGGGNLFHSFGEFDVPPNNIANFLNDTGLPTTNILARVTGTNGTNPTLSSIYGTIQTTGFGNANLFLMNPAGFLFGPNATVNVGGMMAFTSADYLKLTDTVRFNAIPNSTADALLTPSPVAAFGFLGSNPGAITVQGSQFTVTEGTGISLVGGNITVQSGILDDDTVQPAQLTAPGGRINLASVTSPGEILLSSLQTAPNVNGAIFTTLGTTNLSEGTTLDVTGDGGGTIRIRGGQFVMDGSFMTADTVGNNPGATKAIMISAQDAVTLSNGSSILASGFGAGTAGDIAVVSPALTMKDGSSIATGSFGDGNAGDIILNVGTLDLANASIQSIATTGGRGGDIRITSNGFTSNSYTISDGGFVSTDAFSVGAAGNITLDAGSLTLNAGEIHTGTGDAGSAGNISITTTGAVSLLAGNSFSRISGFSTGTGPTGDVTLQVGSLNISPNSSIEILSAGGGTTSTLYIDSSGPIAVSGTIASIPFLGTLSSPGPIGITAPTMTINNGSILTSNSGESRAGDIQIQVGSLHMDGGSRIAAETIGPGQGGDISITAVQSVTLINESTISASSNSTGNAGNIYLDAGNQLILQSSSITTQADQASGGAIKITTTPSGTVQLTDSMISASVLDGAGGGGSVDIDPQFVILQNSQILARAEHGPGGNITINITNDGLFLSDANSEISASSRFGVNGTVTIQSPNSPISGQIQPLGKTPLIATSLLNQRCASLADGAFSSFTVAGRDSLPTEPDSWLASPLYAAGVYEGQGVRGAGLEGAAPALSLRQIAPAGFLTQAFAMDQSASCQS